MTKVLQLRKAVEDLIASLLGGSDAGGTSNAVTLEGPRSLKQGLSYQWWISNFDSFSTYDVSVNSGDVSRNVDYIDYKLPIGHPTPRPLELNLVRNGVKRVVRFPIEMVGIVPPDILSVVEDQRIEGIVLTLQLGSFSTLPVNSDTHKSTSVEIATDPLFTNVIWSSLNNTTNKYTLTTTTLPADVKLYLRARFNGNTYPHSAWSSVMFRTDKKWMTNYSSSWTTTWAEAPLRTTSHVTDWITETYSVLEAENRTTKHLSITSRTTSWDTGIGYGRSTSRQTEYLSQVSFNTSKQTSWLTTGNRLTTVSTGTSDYDEKTTSWDTQAVWTTKKTTEKATSNIATLSRTTTYDTTERKNTNWTTSWGTSGPASTYTSYITGGTRTTSITTSWTSTQSWTTNWTTSAGTAWSTGRWTWEWENGYFDSTIDWQTYWSTSAMTAWAVSRTTSVSVPMSRTTSWTTSDAKTTGHSTAWTTYFNTAVQTGVITNIVDNSRTTSINTSKHTAI